MKQILYIAAIACGLGAAQNACAQKKHDVLTISNQGIKLTHNEPDSTSKAGKVKTKDEAKQGSFTSSVLMFDIGLNMLQHNTDYTDPTVKAYLNVPASQQNDDLFDLRPAKAINVNIYPWMLKYHALKTKNQRIYISSGVGFQVYNLRYENPITYTRNPAGIGMDTISFMKNKLAVNYLNVPLMLTMKTRITKDRWLAYGAGITAGYRLSSWTKQKSDERGKVKQRDSFGLADFNTCITAELGIEGYFRFFASYQLTSLYSNGIEQRPICFGLRFSSI